MTEFQTDWPHEPQPCLRPFAEPGAALDVLRRICVSIAVAPNFETALRELLQLVCTEARWAFGEVWVPTTEGCLQHSGIWYTAQADLVEFAQESLLWTFLPEEGLPGRVWQQRQIEWSVNVTEQSLAQFPRRDLALRFGLGAGLGIPIVFDNRVLAVLIFFMQEHRQQVLEEIQLAEVIATQLGLVLQLKRAESELIAHQQHLDRLVNTLPGIVFTAKGPPDWKMRSLSDGCHQLTGYCREDLIHPDSCLSYNDITHPEDLPQVLASIQASLTASRTYEVEYRILTRTGEEKWVWEKGQGIFDATGQVHGLQGFITEITSLKQVEAALRESEKRYRLLAEQSQDLISQHDLRGICRYVSPACRRLLGYEPRELLGQSAQALFHPQDRREILQHYRQFLRSKQVQTLRFRMRHRNGDYRWFETISGIVDQCSESGNRLILAVSRDITERVRAEQVLIERERFLSLVLDSIPQHLFWKDVAGVYLGCNQAFALSVGLSEAEEVVGKTDFDIPLYTAQDADYFRQQDCWIMMSGKPEVGVLEPQKGSPNQWISCSKFPIYDADNQVIGILGALEDVSDRILFQATLNRREHYLTALVELQRHLLELDHTWDNERFCAALQPLGEAAEASRVYIYEVVPQADQLVQRAQWVAPEIWQTYGHPSVLSFAMDGPAAPWIAELSQGNCVNQTVDQFPPLLQTVLGEPPSSVQSILLLPLSVRGRFSGVVGFSNCHTARVWTRSEVALLQVAANVIAIATERYQAEASLRQAEIKYRSIVENAVEGIFQTTPEGRYVTVNPMLAQIYGYASPEELMASLIDIQQQLYVDPHRRDDFIECMLREGAVLGFESAVYRKDGSIIWISESARTMYDNTGQVVGFEGTVEDITARKQAELELHRRDRLLQGVAQASKHLLTTVDLAAAMTQILSILGKAADADRVYIYENHRQTVTGKPAMSMRYEWTQADIAPSIDQPHWQNQSYEEHGLLRWYRAFQAGRSIRGLTAGFATAEQALLARDNIQSILRVPILIDQDLWGYIGFDACREAREWTPGEESILITIAASIGGALKRRHAEEQMRYQAFHDPLTGLPNRMAFNQHLPLAIAEAQRAQGEIAVMFLDLDRFKNINDSLGHAVGDQLLVQVTQRLTACLRKDDMLARWGGDEFTLILKNLPSVAQAEAVAHRLGSSLRPPFLIENQELYVTSSIGIAIYPVDGNTVKTLLQHADAAMYSAKADGRNTYRFYTSTLNSRASQQLTLEKHLHQALQKQEFRLFFQPQIDVQRRQICQVEALIRWHNPELGWVAPNSFIPIAEEIGLIVELGDWVLKQACYQLQTWHQQGFDTLGMAVNLSAKQLQQPTLAQHIGTLLQGFDLSPQCLEIEITETAALLDIEASIATMNQLRQIGTRLVMDDFGTGYSSLSYLKRLPFQGLKIDRAFVEDIPTDLQDVAMLRAVIALGQELQLRVVAEGVETPEQMACLQELGCRMMQGYWFSHPLSALQMTAFLQAHWPHYNADNV